MAKTLFELLNGNSKKLSALVPPEEGEELTAKSNATNRQNVVDNWRLGPEKASPQPTANTGYWNEMAKVWAITPQEARRQVCANCEYYQNTPEDLARMEAVPLDKFDLDGGGRGFCEKFDFICHSLRTCQAWEPCDDNKAED